VKNLQEFWIVLLERNLLAKLKLRFDPSFLLEKLWERKFGIWLVLENNIRNLKYSNKGLLKILVTWANSRNANFQENISNRLNLTPRKQIDKEPIEKSQVNWLKI